MPKYIFASGDEDSRPAMVTDTYIGFYPEGIFDANSPNNLLEGPVITLGGWHDHNRPIGPRKMALNQVFERLGITREMCEKVFAEQEGNTDEKA
jgi:hypothetical protein